ncbi:MAG: hypothetical protein J6I50_00750 [Clostridia bacterium]|nr:hypothetical protein [Clostridia bacterium]
MIYPSIDEITKGQYNRYTLCIATAKCARIVTDEYVAQREIAEKMLAAKETDKSLASMIKREIRDDKAVKTAIKRLYNGEYVIKEDKGPDRTAKIPHNVYDSYSMRLADEILTDDDNDLDEDRLDDDRIDDGEESHYEGDDTEEDI